MAENPEEQKPTPPKPEEIGNFLRERGVDPTTPSEAIDGMPSLVTETNEQNPPKEGGDPDAETEAQEAARLADELLRAKTEQEEEEIRRRFRESTTVNDAPPRTGPAELPRFL